MKNQRGIIWAPILIMVGVLAVTGVATYMLFQAGNTNNTDNVNVAVANQVNNNVVVNTNTVANTNTVSNTNAVTDPYAGWKTYTNTVSEYSFRYPSDWTPKTVNSSYSDNKAILSTLQNPGFQEPYGAVGGIFVNYYANNNVSGSLEAWFLEHRAITDDAIRSRINGPCAGTAAFDDVSYSITDGLVGGLKAKVQYEKDLKPTYCEGGATTTKSYYVKKGNIIYEILASSPTGSEADTLIKTFDEMVLTYQFLE